MNVFSFQSCNAEAQVFAHMDLTAASRILLLRAKDNGLSHQRRNVANVCMHTCRSWLSADLMSFLGTVANPDCLLASLLEFVLHPCSRDG